MKIFTFMIPHKNFLLLWGTTGLKGCCKQTNRAKAESLVRKENYITRLPFDVLLDFLNSVSEFDEKQRGVI